MKVCLCASLFKRILAAARRGGFKGTVKKTTSKDTKRKTSKSKSKGGG